MKILYIGSVVGCEEYTALKKIYKNVDFIKPQKSFFLPYIFDKIFLHVSPKILEPIINQYIFSRIKKSYDLIFVRSGEFIGKKLILKLKKKTKKIIFLCHENPFILKNNVNKKRLKLCLSALQYYDLMVFHQPSRIKLAKKFGIKKTLVVLPLYKKTIHRPQKITVNEKKKLNNDVIFIGQWMPEKGKLFKDLIEMGLDLKIYGTNWKKDTNFQFLSSRIKLGYVSEKMYCKLIQCSKIALSFPSQGNVDDITGRSIEIPAIGTLLCAFRTKIHEKIFIENKEAIFFKNAKECYRKCNNLLLNEKKLIKIAYRGHIKVTKVLKADAESQVKTIVSQSFSRKTVESYKNKMQFI